MEERPEFMAVPGGFALVDKRKGRRTLTTYLEGRERLDAMRPLVGEAESPSEWALTMCGTGQRMDLTRPWRALGGSMATSVGSIVVNVTNVARAAEFWGKALGYAPQPHNPDFLAPENGEGPRLHLDETDQTHLDLWVDGQDSDQQTEVERLISLGATRVDWDYPPDADFVVLADTEGNVFCVIA